MTTQEFSDGFSTLLNSYAVQAGFGDDVTSVNIALDEYEKSLFLTKAQEDTVISLYTGRNPTGRSFEETEELRKYLSNLVDEKECEAILPEGVTGMESYSRFYQLPSECWFITYEAIKAENHKCGSNYIMEVTPVSQDEYHRIRKNPFRGANDRRALRLDLAGGLVEIISKYEGLNNYYIRFLKKPEPIILENLQDGLTINGEYEESPCKLHEALHQTILEEAVRKALLSKSLMKQQSNN